MRLAHFLLGGVATMGFTIADLPASADPIGKGLVMYMQMGGNPGDGATLDQLLYLQGFFPVVQCVMTAKYKMPGLSLNTGAGTVTPKTIDALTKLIDAGIR
jgi:hypothetical protein